MVAGLPPREVRPRWFGQISWKTNENFAHEGRIQSCSNAGQMIARVYLRGLVVPNAREIASSIDMLKDANER